MTPAAYLPKLEQHLAAMPSVRDARSDNERADRIACFNTTATCISNLMNLPANRARLDSRIAEAQSVRDAWLAKCAELSTPTDDEQQANLKQRQLQLLHQGTLWSGPGTTYGTLGSLEARVEELTARRDQVQKDLDTWLAIAEQLLGQPVS